MSSNNYIILEGLSTLAGLTGCSGIVDMSKFELLDNLRSLNLLLKLLP
jgi:hypothetical protein